MGRLVLLAIAVILAFTVIQSCSKKKSSSSITADDIFDRHTYLNAAKALVRQKLRDPGSAEFSALQLRPGSNGSSANVCGFVNSRNGFGGMTGPMRFIAGHTVVLEEEIGEPSMNQLWNEVC